MLQLLKLFDDKDDVNVFSGGDTVVRRLDSGVKYTQVVICPKAAPRTHIKPANGVRDNHLLLHGPLPSFLREHLKRSIYNTSQNWFPGE